MSRFGTNSTDLGTFALARWAFQLAQAGVIIIAALIFGLDIPLVGVLVVFTLGVLFNVFHLRGGGNNQPLDSFKVSLALGADVTQLSAILLMSGGLANPFSLFLLAPGVAGAALLKRRHLVALGAYSAFLIFLLSAFHLPLQFVDGSEFEPSPGLQMGVLAAFLAALCSLIVTVRRLSGDALSHSEALMATQAALKEQQRISAIGVMAAAIAHELATPLATIKLTATELKHDLSGHPDALEDAELIAQQAERCRGVLAKLSELKASEEDPIRTVPIIAALQEAAGVHATRNIAIRYFFKGMKFAPGNEPQPEITRRPELVHGLRNLIQNAVDFATARVWINVDLENEQLRVSIVDDGEGFSADILKRLGEPFTTTRGRGSESQGGVEGMGLGVFIAANLLEHTGAKLRFMNAADLSSLPEFLDNLAADADAPGSPPTKGAVVEIVWSAADIVAETSLRPIEPSENGVS